MNEPHKKEEIFTGYIPVIHDGYIKAFDRHPEAKIEIFDRDILADIPYLRKDIRALQPEDAVMAIEGLGRRASIIGKKTLELVMLHSDNSSIIMPDDDVTRLIIEQYPDSKIQLEPIFLRWDRLNSSRQTEITPDRIISLSSDDEIMSILLSEAQKSSNWWRNVGALFINQENQILLKSHNSSVPTEYTSWIEGDPRITSNQGEDIETSIDIHAEARAIAQAAQEGIELDDATVYVSTFPCPNCAKLLAISGVKKCYYIDGYSMLDGYSIMKNYGIEIIKIDLDDNRPVELERLKKYPKPTSRS